MNLHDHRELLHIDCNYLTEKKYTKANGIRKLYVCLLIAGVFLWSSLNLYGQEWIALGEEEYFTTEQFATISLNKSNSGEYNVLLRHETGVRDISAYKFANENWELLGSSRLAGSAVRFAGFARNTDSGLFIGYIDINVQQKATVRYYNGSHWVLVGERGFTPGLVDRLHTEISPNGIPHVAYYDATNGGRLSIMKFENNSWSEVILGLSVGPITTAYLFFDNTQGVEPILYVAFNENSQNGNVTKIFKYEGGAWIQVGEDIPISYFSVELKQDPQGNLYLVPYNAGIYKYENGSWNQIPNTGMTTNSTFQTLEFDGSGTPYLAYGDSWNFNEINVSRYNGTLWEPVGTSPISPGQTWDADLLFDSDKLILAYNGPNGVSVKSFSVGDNIPPEINCHGDLEVAASTSCQALIEVNQPVASDDTSSEVLLNYLRSDGKELNDPFEIGITVITWTAEDQAGNISECMQSIAVVDQEPPSITCPLEELIIIPDGDSAILNLTSPDATDNCQIEMVTGIRDDGMELNDPFPLGVTTITWTAEDASGNISGTCNQLIKVYRENSVISLIMLDPAAGIEMFDIYDEMIIDISQFSSPEFNILANVTPGVSSVRFKLTGQQYKNNVENSPPYSLFGNLAGEFKGKKLEPGQYTIQAIPFDQNGVGGTEGIGLEKNFTITSDFQFSSESQDLKVYPNPTSDYTNISMDTNQLVEEFKIFTLEGELLDNEEFLEGKASLNIDMSGYPTGIYILKVRSSDGELHDSKISVQR